MDHFTLIDGVMHAEDVSLVDLAEAVGSPTYIYSRAMIQQHARIFREAVAKDNDAITAFAVKANPNAAILKLLAKEGFGADVVSGGELQRALAAGIDPAKIIFSGVGKTEEEMRLGLDAGIFQFNLESEEEAITLSAVAVAQGKKAPVAYRINPDIDAGTHSKISTGKSENKFGIAYEDAPDCYARAAALPGLAIQGVDVHIGSQLTSLAPLEAAFVKIGGLIRQLRAEGHAISVADLGGGLGVPYDPAKPLPPTPAEYGEMVHRVTADWDLRLVFEPGRLIVGNAGILLSRVIRVKQTIRQPFIILDAAMNDLMRPSLYDAYHHIRAVAPSGAREQANIVGPVCETGDTFAMDRSMESVVAGDLVAIMTAGAYGATMANTYNSRPLVAEVLVSGSQWAVIRKRQTLEEITAGELTPDWL